MLNEMPGLLSIDHIAIAVVPGELEQQLAMYTRMGFVEVHCEDVLGGDQVREVLLQLGDSPSRIQLLEPLGAESPVAKQIEKNAGRGGVVHIAYRVTDINAAFAYMKRNGFHIVDAEPRRGSRGTLVFFVHPKTTDGVGLGYLLEVVQNSSS